MDAVSEGLEQALAAVIANDRARTVAAAGALTADPERAFELLRYIAWAALRDVGGPDGLSSEQQEEVSWALRGPASPWAAVFGPGVLEAVVRVLAGGGTDLSGVPRDEVVPALLAVAAYAVVRPVPSAEWFDWRQHYRAVVGSFMHWQERAAQPAAS